MLRYDLPCHRAFPAISGAFLKKHFNRPMTPDDAVKAFRQHIINITGDANIRIILK